MTQLYNEIGKHLSEARAPHYRFVQFLTALCAGMLALSAPQGNNYSFQGQPFLLLLSVSPLPLLALAIALGAIALHGETALHMGQVREIEKAIEKHNGDQSLAAKDIRKGIVLQPTPIYRWAFYLQCVVSALAVLLLVSSKVVPSLHEKKDTPTIDKTIRLAPLDLPKPVIPQSTNISPPRQIGTTN